MNNVDAVVQWTDQYCAFAFTLFIVHGPFDIWIESPTRTCAAGKPPGKHPHAVGTNTKDGSGKKTPMKARRQRRATRYSAKVPLRAPPGVKARIGEVTARRPL